MLNVHLIWRQTFINTLGLEVWGLYQNVFVCFKLGKVFKSVHHLKIIHTVTRALRGLVKCALFSSNAHFFILYLSHNRHFIKIQMQILMRKGLIQLLLWYNIDRFTEFIFNRYRAPWTLYQLFCSSWALLLLVSDTH